MSTGLIQFIRNYVDLPLENLKDITDRFTSKRLIKNDFLLREGETCRDLVFVQSGCLRLYYIKDDIEISVWFSFEHSSAVEMYSFISENPSEYFLQAIEDSEIFYLPKSVLNKLYHQYPQMQEMMRNFWEDVILNLIERFTALQKDSAEKRYKELMDKPDYMQKIPQKFLASFIGVTPTSLSRIRKKISKLS